MIHASFSLLCLLTSSRVYFCNSFFLVAFWGFVDLVWVVDTFFDCVFRKRIPIKTKATRMLSTVVERLVSFAIMMMSAGGDGWTANFETISRLKMQPLQQGGQKKRIPRHTKSLGSQWWRWSKRLSVTSTAVELAHNKRYQMDTWVHWKRSTQYRQLAI